MFQRMLQLLYSATQQQSCSWTSYPAGRGSGKNKALWHEDAWSFHVGKVIHRLVAWMHLPALRMTADVSLVVLCNDPARVMTLGRGVIMWVLWLWIDWRPSWVAVLKLKSRILQKSNLLLYFRTNVEFNWREEKRSKSLSCGVGADDIGLWCAIGRRI